MRFKNLSSVFHAELDQLLFRADRLVTKLEGLGKKGLFSPVYSSKLAVASIFYCNDIKSLRSLVEYASNADIYPNEMVLLANWMLKNPLNAFALPTLAELVNEQSKYTLEKIRSLESSDIEGVTDAAQLGQWVGGIDPILVPINRAPKNKFVDINSSNSLVLSAEQLSLVKFEFNQNNSSLICKYGDLISVNVYNLHIHAKIHQLLLRSNSEISNLFWLANQDHAISFSGTRRRQIRVFIEMKIELFINNPEKIVRVARRKLNSILGRRPSSYPFISGDTFRSSAEIVFEDFDRINLKKIKSGYIICCDLNKFNLLKIHVLDKIHVSVIVVLINSGISSTDLITETLDQGNNYKIYMQNLLEHTPGVECLPVGLENKWRARNGINMKYIKNKVMNNPRNFRVMWDFVINSEFIETVNAANILIDCKNADRLNLASLRHRRIALSSYAFVACPFEDKPDSPSIWEAMYLGCIPILKESYLSIIYESIGLPIWVIKSYEELNEISEDELAEKYSTLKVRFNCKALWADYWFKKIKFDSESLGHIN